MAFVFRLPRFEDQSTQITETAARARLNRDLASRAISSSVAFPAIALVAWVATDLSSQDRLLLIAASVATVLFTLARWWLIGTADRMGASAPELWRHLMGSTMLGSSMIWGGIMAYVIASRDLASANASLMITMMLGSASVILHASAPVLRLTIAYLFILLLPAIASGFILGGVMGLSFALLNSLFFVMLLVLAVALHSEYWKQFESERLLQLRAEQLAAAKDAAESGARAKMEFLANVSHELRTPMNGVIGMTTLALDSGLNGGQRELIQTAKDSAESLLALLNDILDFSKIDSGKLQIAPLPGDLRSFLATATRPLANDALAKSLPLHVEIDPKLPAVVEFDAVRLRQVIVNLVSNAIKFTAQGSVRLQVLGAPSVEDSRTLTLEFHVTDTGVGIAADKHKSIFEPFTQADGSITRKFGGTGLGLTISARLVEMWGGHMWLESTLGHGSRFSFTLPTRVALLDHSVRGLAPSDEGQSNKPSSLRILVAEDNLVNQKVARKMLESWGHQVEVAPNGLVAVARFAAEPFDIILMDVHMPEMSGLEAAEEIRRLEMLSGGPTKPRIPIIAVTAGASPTDRERCVAAGMDAYVAKPIRADDLRRTINESLGAPVPAQ